MFGDADFSKLDAADTAPVVRQQGADESSIAELFVKRYARKRWIVVRQDDKALFYQCDEGIWQQDTVSILHDVSKLCGEIATNIRQQQFTNKTDRKAAISRANALCGEGIARRTMNLVRANPAMHVPLGALDSHDWLMGFKGGYIDRENVIHEPDPSIFISKYVAYRPAFGTPCPRFHAHLDYLTRDDPTEKEAILRWFGYCWSGTGQEQKFLFWRGRGGSGVTTLLEIIAEAGKTYSRAIDHKAFMQGTSERFGPATLSRGWLLISNEIDKQGQWSDTTLKAATGSGHMEIEEKNRDPREIRPRGGLNFQGNSVPSFVHLDAAIMRRMMLAEFDQKRGSDGLEDTKDFARKLVAEEGPAIVACILEARMRYDKEDLILPPRWKASTEEYFAEIDTKGLWAAQRGKFGNNEEAQVEKCYQNFVEWFNASGYKGHPGSIHAFVRALKDHPLFREHHCICKRGYRDGHNVSTIFGFSLLPITDFTDAVDK